MSRVEIEIAGGNIQLDIVEILEAALRTCPEAVERLACVEEVIQHIADQILEEHTKTGLHGYRRWSAGDEPETAIDLARERVLAGADAVAQQEVKHLRRELNAAHRYHKQQMAAQRDYLQGQQALWAKERATLHALWAKERAALVNANAPGA